MEVCVISMIKDKDAKLDFVFDWSEWLEVGETISSYILTVGTGITKVSDSKTTTAVTVWLSGGTDKEWYTVACKITTSLNRIDERTIYIQVQDR